MVNLPLTELLNIDPEWMDYVFDPAYAQGLIGQYKDLIWLALTLISTGAVVYGIFLPQRNAVRQRKHEATLSLIERWSNQTLPHALSEYQRQVQSEPIPLVYSEAKSKLYSFFHTVALLIREHKVEEPLIRKSQIGIGFVAFYNTLLIEQPDLPHKHTYYGRDFLALYKNWKGLMRSNPGADAWFFPSGTPPISQSGAHPTTAIQQT